ncbi:SusC/RagA family TonB-linked outer membrane protein [Olivibacter sitiensis]|uniref:SusC/RagA family TonB-linked outer membrane protein n=1 Tax=Olivibacter sitiensis TaxID=376470 RepID=UPI00042521DC|nr:TonB-dependent receptor [Olivibacter sitiensis]
MIPHVLKKARLLVLLLGVVQMAFGQETAPLQVSGKVTDESGSPLVGVSVSVKGLTISTSTKSDGTFSLNVPNEETVLRFTFIGLEVHEELVGNRRVINVVLNSVSSDLDEVVVIGYGTARKGDITGAISSIKSEELTRLSSVDVNQSIQGRAPGVSVVNNSGEPGAGTKIRIRGTGSVNNSDPLYVVDGFPVNDISHLGPHDIESIDILKDASAVAIYGSRGANGVILVKTKSGAFGQATKVSANLFGGATIVAKTLDLLNASEYALLKLESYANANQTPSLNMQSILDYAIANNSNGTDWQREIIRKGYTQNYNVNVSGGTEKGRFDIGSTYSKENGVIKNTFLDKFLIHFNNEYKLYKNVQIGTNLSYVTYNRSGNDGDFYSGSITQALKTDPVSAAFDSYTNNFGEIYFSYGRNPALSVHENQFRKGTEDRFTGTAFLQIDNIGLEGLSFRTQYGTQYNFTKSRNYYPVFFITADQRRDVSSLTENRGDNRFWNSTSYFSYAKDFGKHNINATLGTEAQKGTSNNMFARVYDVPEDVNLRYLGTAANKEQLEVSGGAGHNSLLSGFFRMNYSFDNRYLFTGTLRADGSSKFMNKWGYFPSFSAGWNIGEESFFTDANQALGLNQLKLRAGWGHVGNQASAGNFDYLALMTNGYTAVFGESMVDGAIQQMLANEELSWETSEQYNIGLDFQLFNRHLSGNVDYFVRNTNDMILSTPIPIYAGMWRTRTNAGSVKNSGVELNLNYAQSVNEDFSFNAGFNISFIGNNVTSLGGGEPLFGQYTITEEGREIGTFYGLQSAGIFKTQEQLDAHVNEGGNPIQPNAGLGDVIFVDQNGDGRINDDDRIYLGSAVPDFTYGFSLSATYKGIDVNMLLQGSKGNQIANYMYSVLYSTSMREWSNSKAMMGRWTPENPNADLPRVHSGDPNQNDRFSDRFVEDGSYLRLRTIQLGYSLPQKSLQRLAMKGLRVYVSADNLLTFTNYSGFNPEMGDLYGNPLNAGVDMASYPMPRVFTFGINLNL